MSQIAHVSTKNLRIVNESIGLATLYKMGIIDSKMASMLSIREKIDALIRTGKSKGQAAAYVAKSMGMARTSIYRYL